MYPRVGLRENHRELREKVFPSRCNFTRLIPPPSLLELRGDAGAQTGLAELSHIPRTAPCFILPGAVPGPRCLDLSGLTTSSSSELSRVRSGISGPPLPAAHLRENISQVSLSSRSAFPPGQAFLQVLPLDFSTPKVTFVIQHEHLKCLIPTAPSFSFWRFHCFCVAATEIPPSIRQAKGGNLIIAKLGDFITNLKMAKVTKKGNKVKCHNVKTSQYPEGFS